MALTLLTANNAQTVLAAGISASATSLTVNSGTGALFPAVTSGVSFFKLTLVDAATGQLSEIVHVTARTGDSMTIVRAQEGTTGKGMVSKRYCGQHAYCRNHCIACTA